MPGDEGRQRQVPRELGRAWRRVCKVFQCNGQELEGQSRGVL